MQVTLRGRRICVILRKNPERVMYLPENDTSHKVDLL